MLKRIAIEAIYMALMICGVGKVIIMAYRAF